MTNRRSAFDENNSTDISVLKTKRTIIIILLALIAVASLVIAVLVAFKNANKPDAETPPEDARLATSYDYVRGAWESRAENGSCYVFGDDRVFYWLNDCENPEEDYYRGNITEFYRGKEALDYIGKTLATIKKILQIDNQKIIEDDVYYLRLSIEKGVIDSIDSTSTLNNKTIELLFVRRNIADLAYGYQFNTGDSYVFKKNADIKIPASLMLAPFSSEE